jgi:hypothetical protein
MFFCILQKQEELFPSHRRNSQESNADRGKDRGSIHRRFLRDPGCGGRWLRRCVCRYR